MNKWCSVRLLPFVIEDDEIFLLLSKDSRFKEWAPFGGTCTEAKGSCKELSDKDILKCLSRELNEESKEHLNLKKEFDVKKCKYLHYTVGLNREKRTGGTVHYNVYFVYWKGAERGEWEELYRKFYDEELDEKLIDKLRQRQQPKKQEIKHYFEVEDIELIPLSLLKSLIYNTILHVQENPKDHKIEVVDELQYINLDKEKEPRINDKLWSVFLYGLCNSLRIYYNNDEYYKDIKSIISHLKLFLDKNHCFM